MIAVFVLIFVLFLLGLIFWSIKLYFGDNQTNTGRGHTRGRGGAGYIGDGGGGGYSGGDGGGGGIGC
eukprot:CAMPEP_0171455032 /NCGR_PEP_ID=MMETSP0945-20130129/2087_1 /TAXON_ID=109269 /ORGANISM="Vaucheria litorea, Strain CCMP2940" /LENGTH=66 /DNA_ID=CAMNT_0011980187 /DNA_START=26 /DNA_END=226 /DNA_ORIENTATION=-